MFRTAVKSCWKNALEWALSYEIISAIYRSLIFSLSDIVSSVRCILAWQTKQCSYGPCSSRIYRRISRRNSRVARSFVVFRVVSLGAYTHREQHSSTVAWKSFPRGKENKIWTRSTPRPLTDHQAEVRCTPGHIWVLDSTRVRFPFKFPGRTCSIKSQIPLR